MAFFFQWILWLWFFSAAGSSFESLWGAVWQLPVSSSFSSTLLHMISQFIISFIISLYLYFSRYRKGGWFTFFCDLLDVISYNNLFTKSILKSIMTFVHNWLSFPQVEGDIEHYKGRSISKLSFPDSPSLGRWGSNHMGPKFGEKRKTRTGKMPLKKKLLFCDFIN